MAARRRKPRRLEQRFAEAKPPADQMVQRNALDRDVAPVLLRLELDAVIAPERLERFQLEQRDLAALFRLVRVESGFLADHVAIAVDAPTGDQHQLGKGAHRQEGARRLMQESDDPRP